MSTYDDVRQRITNFYSIFPDVKRVVGRLIQMILADGFDSEVGSFVNVRAIAEKFGLVIKEVQPDVVQGKHALLKSDKCEILLNIEDTPQEKFFSIAHELYHFISIEEDMAGIVHQKEMWIKELSKPFELNPLEFKVNYDNDASTEAQSVARSVSRRVPLSVAWSVAILIMAQQKHITNQKAIKEISKDVITKALISQITEAVDEEIADYFAANLLIPTERFKVWQNKTDDEIAEAFKVNKGCIQKRKKEIGHERKYITLKDIPFKFNDGPFAPVTNEDFVGVGKVELKTSGFAIPSLRFMVDKTASGNFEAILLNCGLVSLAETEEDAIINLVKQIVFHIHGIVDKLDPDALMRELDDYVMDNYWRYHRRIKLSLLNSDIGDSTQKMQSRLMQILRNTNFEERGDDKKFSVVPSAITYTEFRIMP